MKKLIYFVIALIGAVIQFTPVPAGAVSALTADGHCTFHAELRGDTYHFILFGRDAWDGYGLIVCTTDRGTPISYPLHVRYEAWGSGFGASQRVALVLKTGAFKQEEVDGITGTYRTMSAAVPALERRRGVSYALRMVDSVNSVIFSVIGEFSAESEPSLRSGQLTIEILENGTL